MDVAADQQHRSMDRQYSCMLQKLEQGLSNSLKLLSIRTAVCMLPEDDARRSAQTSDFTLNSHVAPYGSIRSTAPLPDVDMRVYTRCEVTQGT